MADKYKTIDASDIAYFRTVCAAERVIPGSEVGEDLGPEPEVPAVLLVGRGLRDGVRPTGPSSEDRGRDSPDAAGPDHSDGQIVGHPHSADAMDRRQRILAGPRKAEVAP